MAPNKFSNADKREKNGGDNEILGIILVIISAFMLLCIVIQPILGSISKAIAHVVLGLFGLVSYPMFLCTLILGIALIQDRKIAIGIKNIFCIVILAFCACVILQLATSHSLLAYQFSSYVSGVYNGLTAGGVFFGCIAYGISALITPIASYIVFSLAIVATAIYMLLPLLSHKARRGSVTRKVEPKHTNFVKGESIPKTVMPINDNTLFVDTIKPLDQIENKSGTLETLDSKNIIRKQSREPARKDNQFDIYNNDKNTGKSISINENARKVLYGDTDKRIADLAARKFQSEETANFSSVLTSQPTIINSGVNKLASDRPMQKPPKKDHTSKIPGLPGVSIPPSKDFSEQIIGGDIMNGEEISKILADNQPKPTPILKEVELSKIDKKVAKLSSFIEPDYKEEIALDLPPITNGDYFSEEIKLQGPIVSAPDIKQASQSQETYHNDTAETRFSKLYEEEKNSGFKQDDINKPKNAPLFYEEPEPLNLAPIINAEKDYLTEDDSFDGNDDEYDFENIDTMPNNKNNQRSSAFNIDEEVIDKSEKSRFDGEDFTGYYEPMQDTNSIDLSVNNYKQIKPSVNNASIIRSVSQIKIDDYINDAKEPVAPKKKRNIKYSPPPLDLLVDAVSSSPEDFNTACEENARLLEKTLSEHKFPATVTAITRGPSVTRYELEIPPGIPIKRIEQFYSDIEYNLATSGKIRMEIPIHGKRAVGIEIPNEKIDIVGLKDIIGSKEFINSSSPITVALGKDIAGSNIICNLDKMPHLLIAGSTGSGKSACLNSIIISILYKSSPEDVRLILIDPKHVEFTIFKGMPHLLTEDIITDARQAYNALKWARAEMERRYILFGKYIVKNLQEFNRLEVVKNGTEVKIPYIVLIIDELAELMLSDNRKDMEEKIVSMSQKARAAGIHLILATQRPTVNIITGTIKTNLPSRIAFAVKSNLDSRTILDESGAEVLLGRGDMLYAPIGSDVPKRVQGAWVSNEEVAMIADYVRENNPSDFDAQINSAIAVKEEVVVAAEEEEEKEYDDIMTDVLKCVIETGSASTSMIQRRFAVGYARASRIIDQMELHKFIGPLEGSKPRAVYITREQYKDMFGIDI